MSANIELILTGKTQEHLGTLRGQSHLLHIEAINAFERMQKLARESGIDLQIASSYRSYERQLLIWNEKARGKRQVLGEDGSPLPVQSLPKSALLVKILRWSALPGTSRHHWGSDLDVFDARACSPDYQLKLSVDEYSPGGPFWKLAQWIGTEAGRFGFFQPYRTEQGGVHPEPWHLSYEPVASRYFELYDMDLFRRTVSEENLELRAEIMAQADFIYENYVRKIDSPRI